MNGISLHCKFSHQELHTIINFKITGIMWYCRTMIMVYLVSILESLAP